MFKLGWATLDQRFKSCHRLTNILRSLIKLVYFTVDWVLKLHTVKLYHSNGLNEI